MIQRKDLYVGKKLRIITICPINGIYGNLQPGTHHRVIQAPGIIKNSPMGVWVMGVGEPAYLDASEFIFI